MALLIYDSEHDAFGADPLRSFHNGHLGGAYEVKFYVRNDDLAKYYTNVTARVQIYEFADWGEFGDTGWGIKLMYGERQPTEAEWDLVASGDTIALPDIGEAGTGDTSSYYPVWVRVFCPGGTSAQLRDNLRIRVGAYPRVV